MTAPVETDDAPPRGVETRYLRRLAPYVRPHLGLALAATALLLAEGALQLAGPMLTRDVVDVAVPAGAIGRVQRDALLLIGALLVQFACGWGESILTARLGQRVMHALRRDLFAHVQRLDIAWFDRTPVGRIVTRVTSDVESLNELFTAGVVAGLGDLFTVTLIAALMLAVDWRLALATFAVVPAIAFASRTFQSRVRAAFREIRGKVARMNAFLQERLTGMRVVQLFGQERRERDAFAERNQEHLAAQLRSVTLYAFFLPAIEVLTSVALALLLVSAAGRVNAGTVTVGTVAAFLQLARRFFQPLQDLADKYNTLQQAVAACERIFGLLDTPVTIVDGSATLPPRRGGVRVAFEGVWFSYDATAPDPVWVLRDVSFAAASGETLAIVGHTGAGKTTIINLLLRFHDPQRGRITLDGVDIRTLPLSVLRAQVGYVQQDIFLFADDIAANIRLASERTAVEVEAAARAVGADRVIARLPGGYAHVLGERGATVSVGERQLLSFARAVAADPPLLLLDEATSAVDSTIEAEIQAALGTLRAGRTTIAVAHRLSTVVDAAQILLMHHGEVRERGTHRELLALDGLYARLTQLQRGAQVP
ncbi:MAG: ABC transporter ATP-binding protein/permease [Gemmatimonadaceae bacterium]|nr:ABC transporter ATP-binding protein/permease [Gemmatimonadaceae bacterium]